MALLADYAITPDVFDITCHSHEDVCGARLEALKEVLLAEGLVRDLRRGEWRTLFSNEHRSWHRRGKELVKKLAAQGRLREFAAIGVSTPNSDIEWCTEALATHRALPLTGGIIATERVKAAFAGEPMVGRIDQLAASPWWAARGPSVRLGRSLKDYTTHLNPVLQCANSIMFIDPYLDPSRRGYRDFQNLLAMVGGRAPVPSIEVHRVCWEESADKRFVPEFRERIERAFEQALEPVAHTAGLRVQVFLWDDFHARYVISNLVGILMENGFDTTGDPRVVTTWARLGRDNRDDVQREFDPASRRHALLHRFLLG